MSAAPPAGGVPSRTGTPPLTELDRSQQAGRRRTVARRLRQLDERNSPHLHIPSPSAEFLLYEIARLLEDDRMGRRAWRTAGIRRAGERRAVRPPHSTATSMVYLPATT